MRSPGIADDHQDTKKTPMISMDAPVLICKLALDFTCGGNVVGRKKC
jgi:hypothetical protein